MCGASCLFATVLQFLCMSATAARFVVEKCLRLQLGWEGCVVEGCVVVDRCLRLQLDLVGCCSKPALQVWVDVWAASVSDMQVMACMVV